MTLFEQLTKDIGEAMKAKDQARLSPLRMVKAALMNGEVAKGRALEEAEAQQVLASLIKQRRDSIEQFGNAGRQDLVDKETAEIGVLEKYAPPSASAAELEEAVAAADQGNRRDDAEGHGACDEGCDERAGGQERRRQGGQRAGEEKTRRLNREQTFSRGLRLIILKGNAQASHPSSMGPPSKGGGLFRFTPHIRLHLNNMSAAGTPLFAVVR